MNEGRNDWYSAQVRDQIASDMIDSSHDDIVRTRNLALRWASHADSPAERRYWLGVADSAGQSLRYGHAVTLQHRNSTSRVPKGDGGGVHFAATCWSVTACP